MFLNIPVEKKSIFGINTVQQLGYMATDPKKKLLSFSQLWKFDTVIAIRNKYFK